MAKKKNTYFDRTLPRQFRPSRLTTHEKLEAMGRQGGRHPHSDSHNLPKKIYLKMKFAVAFLALVAGASAFAPMPAGGRPSMTVFNEEPKK